MLTFDLSIMNSVKVQRSQCSILAIIIDEAPRMCRMCIISDVWRNNVQQWHCTYRQTYPSQHPVIQFISYI